MLPHFLLLRILLWVPQTKYDTLFWLACFFVCFYGSTNGWLYHLITAQVWFWKYEYFVDINIYTWYWFYIIDKYMEALYLFNMYMYIYIYMFGSFVNWVWPVFFISSSSSLMCVPLRNGIDFFAVSHFY